MVKKQVDVIQPQNAITTDIKGLMLLLGVGRNKALEIGKESGALIKLGGRNVYKVETIKAFIDSLESVQ